MYPRDCVSAAMDELGCKGGSLSSGFSLLQQLGCWHLNLNCWAFGPFIVKLRSFLLRPESSLPFGGNAPQRSVGRPCGAAGGGVGGVAFVAS
ncbi:hypothetical protein SKAU_G00140400 [Synaphobranchus kaupii]|uniref:Uncharacterized protein n=1 Tax=Synaphobranchus kaupii TaxID=118154 RepID=A0A9Q1J389_SYNKA|nr:hypothetical protein SKAU_G00140400 [Synaphobranchus kaupii]